MHNTSFETEQKFSQSIRTDLTPNKIKLHGKLGLPSSQSPTRKPIEQNSRQLKIQKRYQLKSAHPATMTLLNNKLPLAQVRSQNKI